MYGAGAVELNREVTRGFVDPETFDTRAERVGVSPTGEQEGRQSDWR